MSSLILPRRFTSQPQEAVKLNNDFLSSGDHSWLFGGGLNFDLATNTPATVIGSTPGVDSEGTHLLNGTLKYIDLGDIALPFNSPWSVVIRFITTGTAVQMLLAKTTSATSLIGTSIYLNGGTLSFEIDQGSAYIYKASSKSVNDGKSHVAVITYSGNNSHTGVKIFVDGNETGYSAGSNNGTITSNTTTNTLKVGKRDWDPITSYFTGKIGLVHLSNKELNTDLARSISLNPWQIFRAKPRVLYFDVAGGGATASLTHASETDTAQSIAVIAGAVTVSVGHASETETAQAISAVQATIVVVGHASETDTAQSIAVIGAVTIAVNAATETDAAQDITAFVSGATSIGYAAEIDSAQTITPRPGAVTVSIGAATEADTAQAISVLASLSVAIGAATEAGTVGAITPVPGGVIVTLNAASETDTAQAITVFVPGVMTLTADDIAAIADAVWADPVAIAAHAKLDAIIARLTC